MMECDETFSDRTDLFTHEKRETVKCSCLNRIAIVATHTFNVNGKQQIQNIEPNTITIFIANTITHSIASD